MPFGALCIYTVKTQSNTKMEINVMVADESHAVYADEICDDYDDEDEE